MTNVNEILKRAKRIADIRQRRELEKLDEPIRADRWRNLYFMRDGKSFTGSQVHPSEEAALKSFHEWHNEAFGDGGIYVRFEDPWQAYCPNDFSHAIQIPVKS